MDDELEPNIRFCLYKMGRPNLNESELSRLTMQDTAGLHLLQEKLEVRDVLHLKSKFCHNLLFFI